MANWVAKTLNLSPAGLYASDGALVLERRSENLTGGIFVPNQLYAANTWHKVADLHDFASCNYLFRFEFYGFNSSTATVYWETQGMAYAGICSATSYYNASPHETLPVVYSQHHRTYGAVEFKLGSDNTQGNYGDLSIWFRAPLDVKFSYMNIYAQRILG